MRERVKWLDVVHCIGIFLIYLGHCRSYAGYAYAFVFTHHVALFFCISGCAERLAPERPIMATVKKTVKGILVPWLLFALVALVVNTLYENESARAVLDNLVYIAKGSVRNTFIGGLWFLTCISVVRIVFAFIKKLRYGIIILAVCLAMHFAAEFLLTPNPLVTPSLPFNLDSALYYIVYYAIGYVSVPYINKVLASKRICTRICLFISMLVCGMYTACLFFSKDLFAYLPTTSYLSVIYCILRTLMVTWVYIGIAKILENIPLLVRIGQNTLYLCGSEYFTNVLLQVFLSVVGLGVSLQTPLHAYAYTVLLLLTTFYIVVPIDKKLLNWVYQLPQKIFPSNRDNANEVTN